MDQTENKVAPTANPKIEPNTSQNNSSNPGPGPGNHHNNYRRGGGGRGGGGGDRFGGRGGGRFGGNRGDGPNRTGGDMNSENNEGNNDNRGFGNRRGRGGRGGFQNRNMKQEDHQHDGENPDETIGGNRRFNMRGPDDKFLDRVSQLSGPTFDLPPIDTSEKKFNGRNRLYIGNIAPDTTEEDITNLFKPYGEIAELFINKDKNFGFVKVDYHSNAEKAKRELDGTMLKNRNLKIRFAPNSATIKVKNLTQFVSNELIHYAFSVFGEIERAIVTVDERGKPTGEAIIDFARKGSAMNAIRKCSEGCFFLTGVLRPCIAELHEFVDDIDGLSDKNLPKRNMNFQKERETGPRFANPGSFEHEYGTRWKQLYDLHSQKEEALKKELELEKEKLDAQMEYAKYEHETELLRDQLRARELDKERQKREWELKQRHVEEERLRTEELMRRTQEEMEARMVAQQEEMRRRQQENSLFMQAHNLDSLLEQQEQAYDEPKPYNQYDKGPGDNEVMDPKAFMSSYERHGAGGGVGGGIGGGSRFEAPRDHPGPRAGGGGGGPPMANRGHWVSDNRRDDFPANKRRRY